MTREHSKNDQPPLAGEGGRKNSNHSQYTTYQHNTLDRVLDALRAQGCEPNRSGKGWACRCPAHDDRNPSLSIDTGEDGRALLHCHAGCSIQCIAECIGLSMADLFADADSPAPRATARESKRKPRSSYATAQDAVKALERTHGPRTGAWNYHDAQGDPVGTVVRWDTGTGKDIRPVSRNGVGWYIGGMSVPRPLYGLPELLKSKGVIYVCEGEKAADAARACGLAATTSPQGSKSAGKADWHPLAGRDVVILPDADTPGVRYARDVAGLALEAGAASVRIVRLREHWPQLPNGGDLADVLALPESDPDAVRGELEAMSEACAPEHRPKPEPIVGSPVLACMADVKPEAVRWLWHGRIPLGRLSLLVGRPGEGKSFATTDFAARVSSGRAWPDHAPCVRGSVLLVSAEDDPGDTIRPRLDAHDADPSRIHALQAVCGGRDAKGRPIEAAFTLADLDALRQAIERIGDVRLIVVDPIGSYMGARVDAHRDNEVRAVLAPLGEIARQSGAAVLLVAHQRKGAATHADDLVLGSRAFTGIARSVLHLLRDPDDEQRRLLLPGKMNLSVPAPGLAFTIDGEPARVHWEPDPVPTTAGEVLARGNGSGGKGAGNEAEQWLRDVLSDGPVPTSELKALAQRDGMGWRTIESAKQRIGVKATREGFGSDGRWVWVLPIDRQPEPIDRIDRQEQILADNGGVCDSEHPERGTQQNMTGNQLDPVYSTTEGEH